MEWRVASPLERGRDSWKAGARIIGGSDHRQGLRVPDQSRSVGLKLRLYVFSIEVTMCL